MSIEKNMVDGRMVPRTAAQIEALRIEHAKDCPRCVKSNGGPDFAGSPRCKSFSIASGGHRDHCSCDTCY
jgi:hypothetical protein